MSDTQKTDNGRDCKHGCLARSCEICQLERELAAVTAERDALKEKARLAMKAAISACSEVSFEYHLCSNDCRLFSDKNCPARLFLAELGDEKAWEV